MGPLAGIRVIEMKGIGPGPYAGMLLADLGAEVIVVERSTEATGVAPPSHLDIHSRNKKSVVFDVKTSEGKAGLSGARGDQVRVIRERAFTLSHIPAMPGQVADQIRHDAPLPPDPSAITSFEAVEVSPDKDRLQREILESLHNGKTALSTRSVTFD